MGSSLFEAMMVDISPALARSGVGNAILEGRIFTQDQADRLICRGFDMNRVYVAREQMAENAARRVSEKVEQDTLGQTCDSEESCEESDAADVVECLDIEWQGDDRSINIRGLRSYKHMMAALHYLQMQNN